MLVDDGVPVVFGADLVRFLSLGQSCGGEPEPERGDDRGHGELDLGTGVGDGENPVDDGVAAGHHEIGQVVGPPAPLAEDLPRSQSGSGEPGPGDDPTRAVVNLDHGQQLVLVAADQNPPTKGPVLAAQDLDLTWFQEAGAGVGVVLVHVLSVPRTG